MAGMLEVAGIDSPLVEVLSTGLTEVERVFFAQLESDLPPVRDLCEQVARYTGKMLRPTMLLLCGLAAHPRAVDCERTPLLERDHFLLAATMEMVHMSTLVHDDVLDEADTRRRGSTVNRLHGNETAVILGDYLISNAYHLCSQTGKTEHALAIAHTTNVVCEGELLQLHHRDDYSLDEATYVEIIDRKTAALIGLSCRLGALASGASQKVAAALDRFGRQLGIAFQIRDDLLDLTGDTELVGKSLGKDIEKGKLTLPIIHHLTACAAEDRGRALDLVEEAEETGDRSRLVAVLRESGAIEYSLAEAGKIVEQARRELEVLPESPARQVLSEVATAVVARAY